MGGALQKIYFMSSLNLTFLDTIMYICLFNNVNRFSIFHACQFIKHANGCENILSHFKNLGCSKKGKFWLYFGMDNEK